MNITKISIEKPKLIVVIFTLIIFLGILSYTYLTYELVPKFTPPVLTVYTIYPGAAPEEVENKVSKPIEDALASLENIDQITTISRENFSLVRLELIPGSDIDRILQEADRKLKAVVDLLPENAQRPTLGRFDFNDLPVMRLGAFSNLSAEQFNVFAREQIQPALAQVPGVAEVRLLGGVEREIRVNIDPGKLAIHHLSIMQIVQAIRMANLEVPAGKLKNDISQIYIRLSGRFSDLDQLANLVVFENSQYGIKVRLKDLAIIDDSYKEPQVISRINGNNALGIDIKKQSDANAVEMSNMVRKKLKNLQEANRDINLNFEIAQDTSEFTVEAADAVMRDLFYAVILVSLIMLVFLHSIRNSLFVLVSIPTSIIATFIVMYLMGFTLNLLTLLALSLSIGILVDDSIVVIENIYRHIEMGKGKVRAAFDGRMEIGFTAVSITLIDVVVFLPIIFASGLVADLLRQFSVVMVTATMVSLFVSFTLVPLLASRYAKHEALNTKKLFGSFLSWFEKGVTQLINFIIYWLEWAFGHKLLTLFLTLILFVGAISLVLMGFIGIEFTKAGDRSEFVVELQLPKDATLEYTNRVAAEAEAYIESLPGVVDVFSNVGITSTGIVESNTNNLVEISVSLVDKTKRKFSTSHLARKVKLELESQIPDLKVRPIEINLIGLRDDDAVLVTFTGEDRDTLAALSDRVKQIMAAIPGIVETQSSLTDRSNELHVQINRDKMELLGIDMAQVAGTLRTAFHGNADAKYSDNGQDYDINVILDPFDRRSRNDINDLTVVNKDGKVIRLDQFVNIVEKPGPAELERTDRATSVTLKSQVIGRPAGSAANDLKEKLAKLKMPVGVKYVFGGQTKRTTDSINTMIIAFGISVVLVYLILVALYDSYYYPFVVLFSIPLAVIGALLALALSMQSLSVFSILGLVILVGLVGKNAILVVDFTNNLRNKGMELKEALISATRLRFRPVLMTNIAMVIGVMPIAFARGAGSEWKNGLAWALIGGLSSSMFLTLIIVPVVYYSIERTLDKYGLKWSKKVKVPEN